MCTLINLKILRDNGGLEILIDAQGLRGQELVEPKMHLIWKVVFQEKKKNALCVGLWKGLLPGAAASEAFADPTLCS